MKGKKILFLSGCVKEKDNRIKYDEAKNICRTVIFGGKKQTWETKCNVIDSYIRGRRCTEACKLINAKEKVTI